MSWINHCSIDDELDKLVKNTEYKTIFISLDNEFKINIYFNDWSNLSSVKQWSAQFMCWHKFIAINSVSNFVTERNCSSWINNFFGKKN
jgi:hypothetical protein